MATQKRSGNLIAGSAPPSTPLSYQKLSNPLAYDGQSTAIVLKALGPKYTLLLGHVQLIVARHGSRLSHLAIVARERGVPVFLADSDLDDLPDHGQLRLESETLYVET